MALTYPWEGPRTFVRERVTRGSAAGAHDAPRHLMAGRDSDGRAVALCGLVFSVDVLSHDAGELTPCPKCIDFERKADDFDRIMGQGAYGGPA